MCSRTFEAPPPSQIAAAKPVGFPIYVAPPSGSIPSVAAATFTFYLGNSLSPFPAFLLSLLES
jgi:hypothetical protein